MTIDPTSGISESKLNNKVATSTASAKLDVEPIFEHKKSNSGTEAAAEEIATNLYSCKSEHKFSFMKMFDDNEGFINELRYMLSTGSRDVIENTIHHYNNKTGLNIITILDELSKEYDVSDVQKALRNLSAKQNSFMEREYIAYDLMKALNGTDNEKIDELMKKLDSDNNKTIYSGYSQMTRTTGEKHFQGNGFTAGKREITGGAQPETLLQAILNNTSLSKEQKRKYLKTMMNNFAKSPAVVNKRALQRYRSEEKSELESAIVYSNAFYLEKYVARMFGWQK